MSERAVISLTDAEKQTKINQRLIVRLAAYERNYVATAQ